MDCCNGLILCQREVYLSLLMSVKSMGVKVSSYFISYRATSDHLIYLHQKDILAKIKCVINSVQLCANLSNARQKMPHVLISLPVSHTYCQKSLCFAAED